MVIPLVGPKRRGQTFVLEVAEQRFGPPVASEQKVACVPVHACVERRGGDLGHCIHQPTPVLAEGIVAPTTQTADF